MSNIHEYNDLYAFHPGYYIAEMIEDMRMSQNEFAVRMGTTDKTLSNLINGKCNLSDDLALKLANMMGTSVDVWLNLQKTYDQKVLEIEMKKGLNCQKEIIDQIDYSYFVEIAKLPKAKKAEEKITNLCKYLHIHDLNVLNRPDFLVNFRSGVSEIKVKHLINAQAWIQTAMNFSKEASISNYDSDRLKHSLPEIRSMTTQPPEEFLPRLKEIFADCGVSFVLLPYLKNSGINGAVKWYEKGKVLLAINDRRCFADTFWFSLFHEIKHVLQEKTTIVFINSDSESFTTLNLKLEKEADDFAQNYLIPKRAYQSFIQKKNITANDILHFAKEINIHPGIVVGRLQHDKIIPPNQFHQLRQKYKIKLT